MYPVLFRIGSFTVTSFGVLVALAFLVTAWFFARELKRKGDDPELAWDLLGYAAIGGILGAKLYYLLSHWPETAADPWRALLSRGGLTWYGGFLLATALIVWRLRRDGIPVLRTGDAIAPALAIGYAVGRIGCFMVGDDYGRPTDLPWAVAFPEGAPPTTALNLRAQFHLDLPASIPNSAVLAVHPTQLYETGMMLAIFLLLWALRKRAFPTGTLLFMYLALAGVERFVVEIFRAKDDRVFGPFTGAQLIAFAIVAAGLAGIAWVWRRQTETPAPAAAPLGSRRTARART